MKTVIRAFILLLAVTMLFSTNVFAKNDNAQESLVALGDSIPYGYNLGEDNDSPSKYAFPNLMGEDAGMRVRNLAVPGANTVDMLEALESQKYRQAVRHADYITLNIGNNDLLEALSTAYNLSEIDISKDLFEHLNDQIVASDIIPNLQLIIGEIKSLTDAPIVVYNIYNPFQVNDTFLHETSKIVLPGINSTIENLSLLDNVFVADAYTAFGSNQSEYVIPADIHPTIAGQRKLADIGLEALSK